ncbi:MAG: hypothetical protein U0353_20170 [Sandaracinus sp.]
MLKKVSLCAALLGAMVLFSATSSAEAQVRPRGLGLGADVALASGQMNVGGGLGTTAANLGVGGVSLMYWLGDSLALDFILNAAFLAPNGGDLVTQLGFGAGLFGVIARGDNTALELGGRISLGAILTSNDNSVGVLGLEIPLRVEHWFDRHFSVNGQVGISVGIAPREGEPLPFTMQIGSVTGWGGIGFMYYFDEMEGMDAPGGGGGGGGAVVPQGGGYQPPPPSGGGGDPEQGGAGW